MEPISISIAMALAEFVPQIVKWVSGNDKAAETAETIVDVAKKVTGAETGEVAVELLRGNPELVAQFKIRTLEVGLEIERAYLADVQNARNMQIEALHQDDMFSKRFAYYFAAAWSIFTMVYFCWVTFGTVGKDNVRFADLILGFLLGTAISGIFGWLYGTTVRNAKKDDTMHNLSNMLKM